MTKRALCIGINNYPGSSMDLNGCVNDSRDWAAELRRRGFDIVSLLDRQATGAAVRAGIRGLLHQTKDGDISVVTYSGHGSYVTDVDGDESDGADECICPHDVIRKGVITDDELLLLYSERHARSRLLIISDSCNSGTVARFAALPTRSQSRGAAPSLVRFMPPGVFVKGKALTKLGQSRAIRRSSPPGRYAGLLLAGCQDFESSWDGNFGGRPNGAFTHAALQTLQKLPAIASYRTWYKAIRKLLPSQQYPQTPNLYGSSQAKDWRVFA